MIRKFWKNFIIFISVDLRVWSLAIEPFFFVSVGKSRNSVSSGTTRVGLSSVSAVYIPRRMFIQLAGFGSVLTLLDFPSLAAPVPQMKEPEVIR